jgi:hypothetical protein
MFDEDYSEVTSLPMNRDYWQRDDKVRIPANVNTYSGSM